MSDEMVVSTAPAVAPVATASPETPVTTETPAVETPESEKTFTQKDIDAIIANRYGREKVKQDKIERELRTEREQRIRLEERLAQHQPARKAEDAEPQLKDFDDFDAYVSAKAEFIAGKKIQSTLSEHDKRVSDERAKTAQMQTVESWNKRIAAADIPDFADVVSNSDVPMTQVMQQAIMESEAGPKLAYHLATHPEDASKIAGMTPIGAVRALTLIEEGFKKPVAVTQATPPITPTGSRSASIKSLVDVKDFDEFAKRRAAQIAKRR